ARAATTRTPSGTAAAGTADTTPGTARTPAATAGPARAGTAVGTSKVATSKAATRPGSASRRATRATTTTAPAAAAHMEAAGGASVGRWTGSTTDGATAPFGLGTPVRRRTDQGLVGSATPR